MIRRSLCLLLTVLLSVSAFSQNLTGLRLATGSRSGLLVDEFDFGSKVLKTRSLALFSLRIGEDLISSSEFHYKAKASAWVHDVTGLSAKWTAEASELGTRSVLTFENLSQDTLEVHNLVPFGEDPDRVYLSGMGRHGLSRTHLFQPGKRPVNVIVPDNAWDLGFSEIEIDGTQVFGLIRREGSSKSQIKRFESLIFPTGTVSYAFYADSYEGNWQAGLREVFQKRYLYDLPSFDNTLYEREDLNWIKHAYAAHLIYGWDHQFYESERREYTLDQFLLKGQKLYGGDDFVGIWPTWPSLGLDQRNQWDLFRDLPGGLDKLSVLASLCRDLGTKFFICYNPWDADTRAESHYTGMADLIKWIGADGVVLDTQGSSSLELQNAADSVRKGVVMYSEGMAVPKDMPGIVSGRVHNALYYPPMLNLNKLIKPDFAIFRVAELAFERIRREYALSFFNGYGTELNIFRPGRPDWVDEDYAFFGQTLRILRENSNCFISYDYEPLLETEKDGIWVNKWPTEEKTLYTIFSLIPEGFDGPLFSVQPKPDWHFVDLWNHESIIPIQKGDKWVLPIETDAFHSKYLGTNNEGAVGGVMHCQDNLNLSYQPGKLSILPLKGDQIKIWQGNPDYSKKAIEVGPVLQEIDLYEEFGRYEGKIVVQLFSQDQLIDEESIYIKPGTPVLISRVQASKKAYTAPRGMVEVPTGIFSWNTTHGDEFIGYPENPYDGPIQMNSFFVDQHPVTNYEFYGFMRETGYMPKDPTNFLIHWKRGKPKKEDRNKPVIYVSYEDAQAYADWAEKRLPTELEWQYATSGAEEWAWPWSKEDTLQRENVFVTNTLTVSRIKGVDSLYCNPGNGALDPISSYPKGANSLGMTDIVGSVWQMTNDLYDNGANHFLILKGGSYFNPGSSWWYVQGGPRPLHYRQMLLRVSRAFERNATVGFRCVKDKF